jgi:hypothetical protein
LPCRIYGLYLADSNNLFSFSSKGKKIRKN